jgi:hypothetical protein
MRTISTLKDWQIEAFQLGRPAPYFLLQSPGGAGKSLLQVVLAQADIEDTGSKQLILVPRNHIHHGFYDEDAITFMLPGSAKPSRWEVSSNFCSTKHDAKTRELKRWLLADIRDTRKAGQMAAIATHTALVLVWDRLTATEKAKALNHISFRIDESHHVSDVFHDSDLELYNAKDRNEILEDATKLGKVVQYVLRHPGETTKLHLATATFFRGDRRTILSETLKKQFIHYYLPWDEHYQTLGIRELTINFLNYQRDPIDAVIDMVMLEPNERHLIIIPALTHRFRTAKTISILLNGLHEVLPKDKVLDLVSKEGQAIGKELLRREPDRYQAIVACRLFDEGTDWPACSRFHNTDACEQSATLAVQRIFRPLRQHPDKKVVRIYNYLPDLDETMTRDQRREVLSDRLNAFLAFIVTQGELRPNLVKVKATKGHQPRARRPLQELYGEEY